MSIKKIQLNKLLVLMYADKPQRIRILREDIRREMASQHGDKKNGGHFHEPFWHDAKDHVNGITDLNLATDDRILKNKSRMRLYKQMTTGFLDWWNNNRRWTNEPSTSKMLRFKGMIDFPEIDCRVNVSNLLSLSIGNSENRIIYPYFSEEPALSDAAARLALWAINKSLPDCSADEIRILDIIRGKSYSIADVDIDDTEELIFKSKYLTILREWENLWSEYLAA